MQATKKSLWTSY